MNDAVLVPENPALWTPVLKVALDTRWPSPSYSHRLAVVVMQWCSHQGAGQRASMFRNSMVYCIYAVAMVRCHICIANHPLASNSLHTRRLLNLCCSPRFRLAPQHHLNDNTHPGTNAPRCLRHVRPSPNGVNTTPSRLAALITWRRPSRSRPGAWLRTS